MSKPSSSSGDVVPLRVRAEAETVEHAGPAADAGDGFVRPTKIGRYQVLDLVGMGGMGVVCTAYDPKLDRKVAIKLLRERDGGDARRRSTGRARLVREAQALAKLSHPNVITVHDVDTWEGRVYIAMEYVEGQSLEEWIDAGPRPWREVIDKFIRAGRGLAAAHAAGTIHRDFKPQNVLLGDDGRVRVLDFGLAKSEEPREASGELPEMGDTEDPLSDGDIMEVIGSSTDAKLTQVGRSVGTPAYMAPEQHLGERTTPATDQFAFGVSLYEGLYGQLPFRGDDPFWDATAGVVRDPPRDTEVPTWVHEVILRTLRPQPGQRFGSMDAVLEALAKDPARRRRRWLAGGAAVAVLSGIGGVMWGALAEDPPCQDMDQRLAGAWDDERRAKVEEAFSQTGLSYATETWVRVQDGLDGWAKTWVEQRTAVCEATRVYREQSESLLDVRMTCLDRRRGELSALVDVLADADASVVERAVSAVRGLEDPVACASQTADKDDGIPDDPEFRGRLEAVLAQLHRGQALRDAGKVTEAAKVAAEATAAARTLDHRPTLARALLLDGETRSAAGDPAGARDALHEAVLAAAESNLPDVEALAWVHLVVVDGERLEQTDRGLGWRHPAEAAIRRTDDPDRPKALLEQNLGGVHLAATRFDAAREHLQRAVEIMESDAGRDHPQLIGLLSNLATTEARLGNLDAAEKLIRDALGRAETTLGPGHPLVATIAYTLGNILAKRGRDLDEAGAHYQRAREIFEAVLRPDHPRLAKVMAATASLERRRGNLDAARQSFESALAVLADSDAVETIAVLQTNLGTVLLQMDEPEAAEQRFRAALERLRDKFGDEHLRVGRAHVKLCVALRVLGRIEEARQACKAALETFETVYAQPHADVVDAKLRLAEAEHDAGHLQTALTLVEAAVTMLGSIDGSEAARADAQLVLASVLRGNDAARAAAALERARPLVDKAGDAELRERFEALVAERR